MLKILKDIILFTSFGLSAYNWWYNFYHTCAKINIIFKGCRYLENVFGRPLSFYLIIENLSHLDVSISRMILYVDNKCYEFDSLPYHIIKYESPIKDDIRYSGELPLTIHGLGARGDFFCIRLDDYYDLNYENLLNKEVGIYITTNRKFKKMFKFKITSDKINIG